MYTNPQVALLAAAQLKSHQPTGGSRVTAIEVPAKVSGKEVTELADFFTDWLNSHDPEPVTPFLGTPDE